MSEVLTDLKEQLAEHQRKLKAAKEAVAELKLAIASIEAAREDKKPQQDTDLRKVERPRRKRGEVKKAVLDAVREGDGTVKKIHKTLSQAGIETSPNSISNTLSRLHKQDLIRPDLVKDVWVAVDDICPRNRNLAENAKDPAHVARSSQLNGEAGLSTSLA